MNDIESLAAEVQRIKDHFGLDEHWGRIEARIKQDLAEAKVMASGARSPEQQSAALAALNEAIARAERFSKPWKTFSRSRLACTLPRGQSVIGLTRRNAFAALSPAEPQSFHLREGSPMGIEVILLVGVGLFLLFGTHTDASVTVGTNGLQTGGPMSDPQSQRIAAGRGNSVAQQISAGQGNQVSQDISAGAGALAGIGAIIKGFNQGGGATVSPSPSPNDLAGGTQTSNNSSAGDAGTSAPPEFSLTDPSSGDVPIDYSTMTFSGDSSIGMG
jgi:hypothetical protein